MKPLKDAILSRCRLGEPIGRGSLKVHPLIATGAGGALPRCLLVDEALSGGLVDVSEVAGDTGIVAQLRVSSRAELPVLLIEGDELAGGKQNRVLNTTLLIPAGQELIIPVSCVEQGRWSRRSSQFRTGSRSPHRLHRTLRESVSDSLSGSRGYSSDQGAVWSDVADSIDSSGIGSPTLNLSDSYTALGSELGAYAEAVALQPDQVGLLVTLAGRAIALEVFPDSRSYAQAHPRLVDAYALSALQEASQSRLGSAEALMAALGSVDLALTESPSIGLGRDLRAETPELSIAALELDGDLVYACALAVEAD